MNTPKPVADSERLERILSLLMVLLGAYQDIISMKEMAPTELRGHALKAVGTIGAHVARAEREIAKVKKRENG